jgi:Putative Actinobacterial Holin-X, holin superfamily III
MEPKAEEPAYDEDGIVEPISDLVDHVGRKTGTLVVREVELAAARRTPAIRRAGRDVAIAAFATTSLVAAFALANWAAVVALADVLANWLAPLLLAAAWLALGVALVVALRHRYRGIASWTADHAELVRQRDRARDEAEAELRDAIEILAETVAASAEARIRDAVVPTADGVVDAGEDILDVADDLTDAIEEAVPGGGLVNGALDLALLPGRFGVRVARAVLVRDVDDGHAESRDAEADESSDDQARKS